jgi:hypothetical protein
MEKELGLDKFYRTMTREQKFEKMKNNLIAGKKKQEEMKKNVEISIQQQMDEKESSIMESTASFIAKKNGFPFIDALNFVKAESDKAKNTK